MKIGTFSRIALLTSALVAPGYAEKVKLEQLPSDLQAKIRSQTGGARIEDIDRDSRNGKTTYEVAFKNDQGQNTGLVFEDTGTLAGSSNDTTLDSRKITYAELPSPVRRSADTQIAGGEVNDVERKARNGRVTYGIGYKGANGTGPQRELVLDARGNILRGRTARAATASSSATVSPATGASTVSVASRTINYADLPQNVKQVAEAHLNKGAVERVERQSNNGQVSYFVNFKKDDGEYQQMLIGDDGRIVSNQLVSASAAGSSGAVQSDATASTAPATQASQYRSVLSPVQMRNSTVVDRSQVPAEVRSVIREQSRNGNVEEILRGDWSGQPVYQIAFTDQNQKYVELQVDQKGQIIYDPRKTNNTPAASTAPTGNLLQNIGRALLDNKQ